MKREIYDVNIVDYHHLKHILKNKLNMKRLIQKILLWWSYKKPKKRNKSIWDL
jgi:hypothetical protein